MISSKSKYLIDFYSKQTLAFIKLWCQETVSVLLIHMVLLLSTCTAPLHQHIQLQEQGRQRGGSSRETCMQVQPWWSLMGEKAMGEQCELSRPLEAPHSWFIDPNPDTDSKSCPTSSVSLFFFGGEGQGEGAGEG